MTVYRLAEDLGLELLPESVRMVARAGAQVFGVHGAFHAPRGLFWLVRMTHGLGRTWTQPVLYIDDLAGKNVGLHGLDIAWGRNYHAPAGVIGTPGGRNMEWSSQIAEAIIAHCNYAPPEVVLDAIGYACAQMADSIVDEVNVSPVADQMKPSLASVAQQIFHHDPMHTFLGVSILCSASAMKYVAHHYRPQPDYNVH